MNLGQMIDEVIGAVGDPGEHAEIVSLLNRSADRCARDLEIPQYYVEVEDVTGEFELPNGAREGGLLEVRRKKSGYRFKIYSTQEADRFHSGWVTWDNGTPQFMIFDPRVPGLSGRIRPVPTPKSGEDETLLVTYVAQPDDMEELTDEPFDGHLPEFHEMIPMYVCYQLLLRRGDDRRTEFFSHYRRLKMDAYNYLGPRILYPNNPLWAGIKGGEYQ